MSHHLFGEVEIIKSPLKNALEKENINDEIFGEFVETEICSESSLVEEIKNQYLNGEIDDNEKEQKMPINLFDRIKSPKKKRRKKNHNSTNSSIKSKINQEYYKKINYQLSLLSEKIKEQWEYTLKNSKFKKFFKKKKRKMKSVCITQDNSEKVKENLFSQDQDNNNKKRKRKKFRDFFRKIFCVNYIEVRPI